jgi:two-component system, LytTR family, response regulator
MAARYSILVVDDEPLARERIIRLLAGRPEFIVRSAADSASAIALMRAEFPDILLLDVRMPGSDGFDLLGQLGTSHPPVVIMITAFGEYAVRAFEAQAFDYLVKPFDDARFAASLARAQATLIRQRLGDAVRELAELQPVGTAPGATSIPDSNIELEFAGGILHRVLVPQRDGIRIIPVADIDWVAAEGNYVRIVAGRERPLYRSTLGDLAAQLDSATFVRIHRSTIVNLDRISELRESSRGEYYVVLKSGIKLKVSRARRGRLERLLGGAP